MKRIPGRQIRDRSSSRLLTAAGILGLAFVATYLGTQLVLALYAAGNFNGHPMNGAFQIYNPLRRIAAGELPGRDFPFFHGVGVPWIHYPLFALLGGGLFGSEMSRILLSPLLFVFSSAVFFTAMFRSWKKAAFATALIVAVAPLVTETLDHGNAVLGVRSTVPVLVAAVFLWRPRRAWLVWGSRVGPDIIVAPVLLGLSFSLGAEQGLAAIAAYLVMRLIVLWRSGTGRVRAVLQLVVECAATGVLLLLWLLVFTGGHALIALKYALVDVAGDQSWYFGGPPNPYLTVDTFFDLTFRGLPLTITLLGVATSAVAIYLYRRGSLAPAEPRTFLYMGLTGLFSLASFLGYFWPQNQMSPLGRLVALVLVGILLGQLFALLERDRDPVRQGISIALRAAATSIAVLGLVASLLLTAAPIRNISIRETLSVAFEARHQPDSFVARYDWATSLEIFRPYLEGSTFWSTWAGIQESNLGVFQPSTDGEDYIIHALGPERRSRYEEQFVESAPDFAITVNPSLTGFEGWLWTANSGFYKHLFTDYDLKISGNPYFLWERRTLPVPQVNDWVEAEVQPDGRFTVVGDGAETTSLVEVTVHYRASSNLPLLDKIPRYFIRTDNSALVIPVALPSYQTEFTFLVPLIEGQGSTSLSPYTDGIVPTASLRIDSAEYRVLDIPDGNKVVFYDNYCPVSANIPATTGICP